MNFRSFSASLRNIIDAFFRGELLMRIGADKYFPHIAYTFMLFWVMILMDMMIENTLVKAALKYAISTQVGIPMGICRAPGGGVSREWAEMFDARFGGAFVPYRAE